MTCSPEAIAAAARLLRAGKLVAFPTETVYGLGANALDAAAVSRIFEAKGRPATSPLIVHVASLEMARQVAAAWPEAAQTLAREFWPGPLTLVLPKQPSIPDRVTAGLPTVGIRMPDHPLALALIREAGVPVAAPSANRFTGISPTLAEHVRASLGDAVDCILDGGETQVGLESTVLSLATPQPLLLRPGMVQREDLEAWIGPVITSLDAKPGEAHASPGQHRRHYSPSTRLLLLRPEDPLPRQGAGVYVWHSTPRPAVESVQLPADARGFARQLYRTLHSLDRRQLAWIAMEPPPDTPAWAAVHDRLRRAVSS